MRDLTRRQWNVAALGGLASLNGAAVILRHDPASATEKAAKKFEIERTPEEWRKLLSPEQYYVLRDHGTERPFTHPYDKLYDAGVFNCAGCDLPLFASTTKYDSRTGWPSFWQPLENAVGVKEDRTLWLMVRTEVHCKRCGGHLGHVFNDGPKPTGLRYCINGIALKFVPAAADAKPGEKRVDNKT